MTETSPTSIRRRLARAVIALTAVSAMGVTAIPAAASAAPVKQAPITRGGFTTGYSLCYTYYYSNSKGKTKNYSYQKRFSSSWLGTLNATLTKSFHYSSSKKTYGYFYQWAWGTNGKQNCTVDASIIDYRVVRNGNTITIYGRTNRPGLTITLNAPDGALVCTTTSSTTGNDDGGYPFTCSGDFDRPSGSYDLTLRASAPRGLRPTTRQVLVVIDAAPSVRFTSATPNPTTGPVTVTGTTNLKQATVTVTNDDAAKTPLCSAVSASTAVSGQYAWSCTGTVLGNAGTRVLTATVSDGNRDASATTTVTKSSGTPATSGIRISGLNASPNPTTGPVTVTGKTNRPGSKITVKNQDGTTLCTTTGSSSSNNGLYGFSCNGTVTGGNGTKTLSVKAVGPNGGSNTASATVNKVNACNCGGGGTPSGTLAIKDVSASLDNGQLVVSGTTNRPGAVITVKAANGATLCTATGSSTASNGVYSFSCTCSKSAAAGATLTVRAKGPKGNSVTTTVKVS